MSDHWRRFSRGGVEISASERVSPAAASPDKLAAQELMATASDKTVRRRLFLCFRQCRDDRRVQARTEMNVGDCFVNGWWVGQ